MKRDMDLVRVILMQLEAVPADTTPSYPFQVDGYEQADVSGHIHILEQAGLIEANVRSAPDGDVLAIPLRITWHGHDFIDSIRSDNVWRRTKQAFVRSGATMTFELVKAVAIEKGKELLGIA